MRSPKKIILALGQHHITFTCICPERPTTKNKGCPLHHTGAGGSRPVEVAKRWASMSKSKKGKDKTD